MPSGINRIYYFSGTGNSMRAATVVAQALGNTEIYNPPVDVSMYWYECS